MLKEKEATYNTGITYAFNLMYSSNHFELIEQSSFNKIRIQNGINPYCFKYTLNVNEEFETPFSVLTFSPNGINGSSQNMHNFIHKHILREQFSYKPAPILINNWEATYMKFKQSTLKKIIRAAKEFLNWIVYSEIGQQMLVKTCNLIPPFVNNPYEPSDPLSRDIYEKVQEGKAFNAAAIVPNDHWSVLGAAMQKYLAGRSDREELITTIQKYWSEQE